MYLYAFEKHIYIDFTYSDLFFFSGIFVSNVGYGDDCHFFLVIKAEEVLNEKKKRKTDKRGSDFS